MSTQAFDLDSPAVAATVQDLARQFEARARQLAAEQVDALHELALHLDILREAVLEYDRNFRVPPVTVAAMRDLFDPRLAPVNTW